MGFCSLRWMCCILLVSAFGIPAFAEGSHDRTQFGHDVTVGSDEKVAEVTCFAVAQCAEPGFCGGERMGGRLGGGEGELSRLRRANWSTFQEAQANGTL